jgi:hypothetical protein
MLDIYEKDYLPSNADALPKHEGFFISSKVESLVGCVVIYDGVWMMPIASGKQPKN